MGVELVWVWGGLGHGGEGSVFNRIVIGEGKGDQYCAPLRYNKHVFHLANGYGALLHLIL